MKFKLILTIALIGSSAWAADPFSKVSTTPDILSENMKSALALDASLQPVRSRSLDMMRVMVGSPVGIRSVGPSIQAEWSRRLDFTSPIYLSTGVGYLLETKNNPRGEARNFHQLPVFVTAGYRLKTTKSILLTAEAGPALRNTFERGVTPEQNANYSYGDLIVQFGGDYEWSESLTGAGRSLGLRYSRLFGFAGRSEAAPVDAFMAAFSWDL